MVTSMAPLSPAPTREHIFISYTVNSPLDGSLDHEKCTMDLQQIVKTNQTELLYEVTNTFFDELPSRNTKAARG